MAFGEKMNFFQRVINTLSLGIGKYFLPYMSKGTEDVFRANFGDDFADLNELTSETSLWFYNTEPLIEFPRPILHKIIDVGGISVSTGHNKLNQVRNLVTFWLMTNYSDLVRHHESSLKDCPTIVRYGSEELSDARTLQADYSRSVQVRIGVFAIRM